MDSKEVLRIYMKEFSANLNRIREEKFETMDNVATHSSFDASNYNKLEKAKGNPTIETILKISSMLEVEPKELFNFDFDIKKFKIDM
ncbi:helix-turn-helix transcriptional regulator [Zunongwangia sp. F363]|uniref:Helix-turn-helix transcriptional regulator n=1 Tax=Autumnicola tepida TaxID=3075595 RepID=A0ABU3C7K9_9FLAO|nr:helix-turn-helix transcriptional regulator [Zunongwangia sp. F363]MDT0642177.1 helix-turn-helix transcriptional regulator [Zunongwangia sp. F363]